jgi:hypothetical protein
MILLGYHYKVQASIKFFLHMLLIGWTPKLNANNFISSLVQTFDIDEDLVVMAE